MNVLERLRGLAAELPDETPLSVRRIASGSAFVARTAQHFGSVRHGRAFVSLVLEGKKTVTHRGVRSVLGPGGVLVVPANVEYEASVAARTRVFILEIDTDAGAAFARAHPRASRSAELGGFSPDAMHVLDANEETLLAFAHVASTLLAATVRPEVLRHRLEDLVLSLSLQHLDLSARQDSRADPVLATRALVRGAPGSAWTMSDVARHLAMSPATLRRRLALDGTSLRRIRVEERMVLASALLSRRGATVAEVAAQCGYESPSKFARQYKLRFGKAPRSA